MAEELEFSDPVAGIVASSPTRIVGEYLRGQIAYLEQFVKALLNRTALLAVNLFPLEIAVGVPRTVRSAQYHLIDAADAADHAEVAQPKSGP